MTDKSLLGVFTATAGTTCLLLGLGLGYVFFKTPNSVIISYDTKIERLESDLDTYERQLSVKNSKFSELDDRLYQIQSDLESERDSNNKLRNECNKILYPRESDAVSKPLPSAEDLMQRLEERKALASDLRSLLDDHTFEEFSKLSGDQMKALIEYVRRTYTVSED
jgi:predicted  nucleic acid-binding Zn-ribbon protein